MAAALPQNHLQIGGLIFPEMDQIDFTGPFEVLSRLPGSTFTVFSVDGQPIRDQRGLVLTPEKALDQVRRLDVLLIPGGPGQEALMDEEAVLSFIRAQYSGGAWLLSVCTGALICGAAGLLKGVRATTHWGSMHLLPWFGATPVKERVVRDERMVFSAGVTAGIDGALYLASLLRGESVAQQIQLGMEYAPNPLFNSGTPDTAPPDVFHAARRSTEALTGKREGTARRIAEKLGTCEKPVKERLSQ